MTIRFVLAGAVDAPLTNAAREALEREHQAVDLVAVFTERIRDLPRCDILLSAGHTYLIKKPILEQPRLGSIGFHPSLLPRYRGSHPLWWALRNGDREAGLTLYHLDEGIDSGPIIEQLAIPIRPLDSFGTLYRRVCAEIPTFLAELVDEVEETGVLPPGRPQDEALASVVRAPGQLEYHSWRLRRRIAREVARLTGGTV